MSEVSENPSKNVLKTATGLVLEMWGGVLDLVYPPVCLLCRRDLDEKAVSEVKLTALCDDCLREMPLLEPPFCPQCGEQITRFRERCEDCEAETVFPFVWRQAAGAYRGNLQRAIALYKYAGKSALSEPLGRLMVESLAIRAVPLRVSELGEVRKWIVVPVPLHPSRQRERGFNQAERLARVVAREMGWQLNARDLRRTRKTPKQAGITDRLTRQRNVADAFSVVGAAQNLQPFAGQSVLLVDDVMTTLSTLNECVIAAKNGGANEVALLALARG